MEDARIWKALGSPHRRALLDALKDGPKTTSALCEVLPQLSRYAVMQHLGVLERAEVVLVRREGRERWNYLNPLPIKDIHDRWIGVYAAQAVSLLARLKDDLEG